MNRDTLLASLAGQLIVSCQASADSPMHGAHYMAAFARCALASGAAGLRADGPAHVRAIRRLTPAPIIGLYKQKSQWPVYITPTLAAARAVARAGANIIAIDATHRARKGGLSPEDLIRQIQDQLGCLVMADIDSLEEGLLAAKAGADLVGTTLAGYTERAPMTPGPDLKLLRMLVRRIETPVICEGRIHTPADAAMALAAGAFAVVVGTALTNPYEMTRRFVAALSPRFKLAAHRGRKTPG
ncbi:MAG TPA: N-acetylmannosamine-6-phosphate 2-epimerase [Candidatus Paceibacterota bacterium]|nr:N-acetylmannosamine-6-phosphate 2-epimerase [Verrucomicrobiota bacterium]HRY46461.1 N-acetylmannosamine-6-phosphate 2-epimerase [Candidatus Paceibacterota bacterium]